MSRPLCVVFARAPRSGHVKTRLSPPLTPEQASAVHEASLRDVVAATTRLHHPVHIRFAGGPDAAAWFAQSLPRLDRTPQRGADPGERLATWIRRATSAVCFVGSWPSTSGGTVR